VRVFDIPFEQAYAMLKRGEKAPEHIANCLYLEWFSETNGRVVIESADYQLQISAPEWRLSPEEEKRRASDAEAGWNAFVQRLTEAVEQRQRNTKEPEAEWDEYDYEQFMKE